MRCTLHLRLGGLAILALALSPAAGTIGPSLSIDGTGGVRWGSVGAQTSTARITGTVTNEAAVPISDATVTARSLATNLLRTARTSPSGFYALVGLQPDEYEITVRRLGMTAQTRTVRVLIGQSLELPFRLTSTAVQLAGVQVSADAVRAEADRRSPEVATNITQEQIENIPLPDRNFLSLALMAPGIRRDGGSITSGAQSANNINVFVDGVSFKNDILVGGVAGQDASKGNPFPQNAVQEFRVITQQYKAEYAKATSAIITATTKSGGSRWEGDVFTYFQNKGLIQRDYFSQFRCDSLRGAGGACAPKARLDKYQLGGRVGGPLIKDKLFFFGSYEGNLQTRAADVVLAVPGTTPPAQLLDTLRRFTGNFESPFRSHLGFGKLTYVPAERHRFELSTNIRDEYDIRSFGGTQSYDNAENFYNDVDTYMLKHQYVRGNGLNEATVSYQSYHWFPVPLYEDKVGLNFEGILKIGGRSTRQDFTQRRLSLRDDYTHTLAGLMGDHVLKAGVNFDYVEYDVIRPLNGNPQFTYRATNGWAFPVEAVAGFGDPDIGALNRQLGAFIQDDWTVNQRLTLNLGVRWDYETDMVNNDWVTPDSIRSAVTQWRAGLSCNGAQEFREQLCDPTPYMSDGTARKPFLKAFQPRVGFSFDLLGNGNTMVFGGWGLYYDRNRYGNALSERANLQWTTYTFRFSSNGLPTGGNPTIVWDPKYLSRGGLQSILSTGAAPRPELFLTNNTVDPPKATQFSFGVRQSIGEYGVSASYTGVRGSNTFTWIRANRNTNGTCCAQFPATTNFRYSNVFVSDDNARNWFDALYLTVEKRFARQSRWGAQIAYTLGKAEEEANPGDVFSALNVFQPDSFVRYPSSSDERHHVTANAIVRLPWGFTASGILDLGSGVPLNATVGFGTGTNACTHGNMDCLSGNDFPTGKGRNWYRPDGDTFLGMGWWRYRDVDVRLEKAFTTLRGQQVGVVAEVFNAFNFRNYSGYNTAFGNFNAQGGIAPNAAFGRPTAVITDLTRNGAPRRFQLGMRYGL